MNLHPRTGSTAEASCGISLQKPLELSSAGGFRLYFLFPSGFPLLCGNRERVIFYILNLNTCACSGTRVLTISCTMWPPAYGKTGDVEAGARPLYPMMLERPELRWAFIRKIYAILSIQLLITIAVAAIVVTVRPVADFFVSTSTGLGLYILVIILPFIVLCPLYCYYQRHPVNLLLLGLFTVCLGFAVGLTCAFTSGKVILESVILTTVVVLSLTLYTFWAVRRGHDFNFLGPFLFSAILVLLVFALIQILFPMGRLAVMIYGGLAAIIFCGYIIYDTDNLIKRYTYDEYIWAAVALYLDVINLFLSLLTLFRAAEA